MLEDSRLRGYFGKVTHPTENLERTYCVICGAPQGGVNADITQVIVLCDECHALYGPLDLPELKVEIQ